MKRVGVANYRIRQAGMDDVGALLVLVQSCVEGMRRRGIDQWDALYPDRQTILRDVETQTAAVAVTEAELFGMIVLNEHGDPEYADVPWTEPGPAAVVHRLMVAPAWEGLGVGRALMHFAETRARERGYATIRLDAFRQNVRALQFYERDGYRCVGSVRFRKGLFDCFEKRLHRPANQR